MKNREFTGFYDDNNKPIYVGDKLKSIWNYEVIVVKNGEHEYSGKLVCDENHTCKDIPYALNKGKGFAKATMVTMTGKTKVFLEVVDGEIELKIESGKMAYFKQHSIMLTKRQAQKLVDKLTKLIAASNE